jgi:hypothetical protein
MTRAASAWPRWSSAASTRYYLVLLSSLSLLLGGLGGGEARAAGSFTELATFRGVGKPMDAVVAGGPNPGSERYYISYSYTGSTAEVVAVDPDTGAFRVFAMPDLKIAAGGARPRGPAGKIYVGTVGEAKILRIDPEAGTIVDLGRASQTESYIWQLALGADRKLYGCTYPNAKLVRCDPATGRLEDLGRMDPEQQYARTLATGSDGFVYTAVGFAENHLVAYEIRTAQHRDLLPEQYRNDRIKVVRGNDGKVYAQVFGSGGGPAENFRLEGWTATPIGSRKEIRPAPTNQLKDGRIITNIFDGSIDVLDPRTQRLSKQPYLYSGKEIDVFRLALGPDGMLYGSTASPLYFFIVNPATGERRDIGYLGDRFPGGNSGEIHSFLPYQNTLVMAAYASLAPLMIYDPGKPYDPGISHGGNPSLVDYPASDSSWRPEAIVAGPNGGVYIGSVAGYGLPGGSLTVFSPTERRVIRSYTAVANQSVTSLARWEGLIVGGTSTRGGGGVNPTETEARIFLWNPSQQKKMFDVVPVTQASDITDLVAAPNGQVFGLAGSVAYHDQFFVFDPKRRAIVHRAPLPSAVAVNSGLYNSLAVGSDGRLYGLFPHGVFSIDPTTWQSRVEAFYQSGIVSAGFALSGRNIYFASGPRLVRYTLP